MKRSHLYIFSLITSALLLAVLSTFNQSARTESQWRLAELNTTKTSAVEIDTTKTPTKKTKVEPPMSMVPFLDDLSLPFLDKGEATPWADSVFKSLTPREKAAQLFMVAAYSNKGEAHINELNQLIKKENIGGLIFFKGDPETQLELTQDYQTLSKTPLWLGMDIEWGLSMRLSNSITYPYQMTLGAMQDDSLVYEMGAQIAKQMKRMGVHVSFSPVLDVNNNPNNPVINYRSFGENRENVSDKGLMYIKGLQDHGVLACAKHFPGHGDTDMDSHLALPTVNHDRNRLDSIELYPFKSAINEGVGSVMVAHLHIPVLDNRENRATTLSGATVNSLLKQQMHFKGLSFTDALNMKGVAKYFKPGEVDLEALKAGNDVLLFPEDVPQALNIIMSALDSGELDQRTVDTKCLKILKTKEWLGLNEPDTLVKDDLITDLNVEEYNWLNQKLADASLTLLRNEGDVIPIRDLNETTTAVVNIGAERSPKKFKETLNRYTKFKEFTLSKSAGFKQIKETAQKLESYDYVIVNLLGTSNRPKTSFGVTDNVNMFLKELDGDSKFILNIFTNAYSLYSLESLDRLDAIFMAYQDTEAAQKSTVDAIMGAIKVSGTLPVSAGQFEEGSGIATQNPIRIRHQVSPLELGINTEDLKGVDKIALNGIEEKAYPGCRVLAMKGGQIFLDRSYGHQTYDKSKAVGEETVYDLASITKIAATTLSLMKLSDEDKFSVDYNLCDYMPEIADTSDYYNMNLKEMLSHTAGLKPWIPFYDYTLVNKKPSNKYYRTNPQSGFSKVADRLWINNSYADSIYQKILKNPLRDSRNYRYSDLGYYLIYKMFPNMAQLPLETYVDQNFYHPLGLSTIGYNPLGRISKSRIAPTENDRIFRSQVVRGFVHDPGAAMLGGACAHAGLFSDAYDMATIMQLFLNRGEYGGQQYFNPTTFDYFNTTHFSEDKNRRGIGFDKPVMKSGEGPACDSASASSFGHSGFTGTLVWADPETDIVYVFLSNRVYPNANNKKLLKMNIRTDIQQVIYDAVAKAESAHS
ncbi:MAG: glycoside hydrolase family 3 N-terminal domain-containing protein [Flavobacteriales bacterium]